MNYHVNGQLVPAEAATVSVRDRGFRYGDGVFETLRVYDGLAFLWDRHRERLGDSAAAIGMDGAVPDDLRERVDATLSANDLANASVRVSVTRGVQPGKLTPDPDVDPTVVVTANRLPPGGPDAAPVWDGPATVETIDRPRVADAALPSDAKTHNYLNGILGRLALRRRANERAASDTRPSDGDDPTASPDDWATASANGGEGEGHAVADECLFTDAAGTVLEGATSNLFFVADGVVSTPAADLDLLAGTRRELVLELADDRGIPVETGQYDVDAVHSADEAFLTNATWELRPVASVDGRAVGGGPVFQELATAFDERVAAVTGN